MEQDILVPHYIESVRNLRCDCTLLKTILVEKVLLLTLSCSA